MIACRLLFTSVISVLICGAVTPGTACAQNLKGILAPGDAAVTGFSGAQPPEAIAPGVDPADQTFFDLHGPSLRVIDLTNMEGPPQAQLVQAPKPFTATAAEIGQVFAVALDDARPPNIYAAASSAYGLPIVAADGTRLKIGAPGARFMPGLFGPGSDGGPGSIWKIDGVTGQVSLFANVTVDGVANSGAALGGLAFDSRTASLFVADRGTGVIHRFALDGSEIGRHDHGTQGRAAIKLPPMPYNPDARLDITASAFNTENSATWGYAPPERRVFGLGVYNERLYYAVAAGLQIWSVAITADGFGGNPRIEAVIPPSKGEVEISKIVFDLQGRMYVSERPTPTGAYDFEALTKEGVGRVLRYTAQEGLPTLPPAWQQNPNEYAIGFPLELRNGNGGVDLGYRYTAQGAIDRSSCGGFLWSTGEQLRRSGDATLAAQLAKSGSLIVDGLQGNAAELVRPQNVPPQRTYFIDYDDHAEDEAARGHLGDVAIWRVCGPAPGGSRGADLGGQRGGLLQPDWWQAGWYGPPPKFPPNVCTADQQQPGFQCCPSGTSPGPNGQCKSWCPSNALDPNSVQHCAMGFDPKGYNAADPASWTCLDGSKPDAQLLLDDKTAPYACIDKSPLHNEASCPAGLVKVDLGALDAKLAGKMHCEKTPEQLACAPGSQVGLDNKCHQICAAGGFAWPTAQCCAAGSVVSVSGKCCPPGSKVDGKTGQCNPPQGCLQGNVKVGGKCCLVDNVGMEAKAGIKSYVCCPNGADPNTGYCLPPPVQISNACDPKQLTPDKKTCCPVGQKPGDGDDSNKCVCANGMNPPVNGVCPIPAACPVAQQSKADGACCPAGQSPNNVIGGCCPAGSKPQGSAGACTCDGGEQPVNGACPTPHQKAMCEDNPKNVLVGGVCCDKSQVAGGKCCPAGSVAFGDACQLVAINLVCKQEEALLKDGKTCCPVGQASKFGDKCCPNGSTPMNDNSCAPAAATLDNKKPSCPDGSLMPPDKICLIDAMACSKAGPGAIPLGDLSLRQELEPACCPAGYHQIDLNGQCANGQLPICPFNQSLNKVTHKCGCSDGKPIPPGGVCPTQAASGNFVCKNTGKPPTKKPGGGLTCDPPPPACAPRFAPDNSGACCRSDLLTSGGRCCVGGLVPDASRASCVAPGCAAGLHWDAEQKACVPNIVIVPSCRPGTHWDPVRKACVADPQRCGANTHWDSGKGACVPDQHECRPGSHWVPGRNICVADTPSEPSCRGGTHWDPGRKLCVADQPSCRGGTHWDAGRKVCVPDTAKPRVPVVEHHRPRPSHHTAQPPHGRVVNGGGRQPQGGGRWKRR
jgi:hypothetical protein